MINVRIIALYPFPFLNRKLNGYNLPFSCERYCTHKPNVDLTPNATLDSKLRPGLTDSHRLSLIPRVILVK